MSVSALPPPSFRPWQFKRWVWVATVAFALTVFHGIYFTYLILPRVYMSTAQIEIQPRGTIGPPGPGSSVASSDLNPEVNFLLSEQLLTPIINDLELDKIWMKRDFNPTGQESLPPEDALKYMRLILHVDLLDGTNVISICAYSKVPQESAVIANAVADRYKTLRDIDVDSYNMGHANSLRETIPLQQKAVDAKKVELEKVRALLATKGIVIVTGPNGLKDAEAEARQKDALAANSKQENMDALDPFRNAQYELNRQQSLLDDLTAELKQINAEEEHPVSPVKIISRAEVPRYPSLPNHIWNIFIAVAQGIPIGLAVATFLEFALWCAEITGLTLARATPPQPASERY